MLHLLFNLTRPLFVFDCETTGTDPNTDRIIEFGFQQWTAEGLIKQWRSYIDPGIPIPQHSTDIHHITDAMIQNCQTCGAPRADHFEELPEELKQTPGVHLFHRAPRFEEIAANIATGFTNCDFAGKRVRFDLQITAVAMSRANVPWSYVGARIIDIDRLEQIAIPRSLSHLHEKYVGEPHEEAHGALSDVQASVNIIVKQLETHSVLPRDLDELHNLQWPGWIDVTGKFKFVNGVPCFGQWGKHANKPMQHPDLNIKTRGQSYWDFILSGDFTDEVKQIARDAKLGIYPRPKA